MARLSLTTSLCAGFIGAACAAQAQAEGVYGGTVKVANTGASMVRTTVGETYNGMGSAMKAPFRDFNLMQEAIPVALSKARTSPYDVEGLTSCEAVRAEVEALDMALGPDIDTPRVEEQRDRWQRGASFAADSAVKAAQGAIDHFIPVRGVIREVSGARRAEKRAQQALLAGAVRRGFLKAIGMQQNCAWPAAPISFKPHPALPVVQQVSAPAPPVVAASGPQQIASAVGSPTATARFAAAPDAAPATLQRVALISPVASPSPQPQLSQPAPTAAASAPPATSMGFASPSLHMASGALGPGR